MNEKERQVICDKEDAYACLKSGCEYAEAADGQFICHKKETRYYKGLYPVEIITQAKHSCLVKALEDIPLTSTTLIQKGTRFLTVTRLLHKQKKET